MLPCDGSVECPKKSKCFRSVTPPDTEKAQALISASICTADTFKIEAHVYPKDRYSEFIEKVKS